VPLVIRCPACGFAGERRDPQEVFHFGVGTIEGRPAHVRECRVCGALFARKSGFLGFLHRWHLVRSDRSQRSGEYEEPPVVPDASRKPLAKLAEVEEEIRRRNEKDR
jgi:hypothetical protein